MTHVFPTYDDTLRRTIIRLCEESEDGGTTMEEIAKAYLGPSAVGAMRACMDNLQDQMDSLLAERFVNLIDGRFYTGAKKVPDGGSF
ncbi:MAG: hypothetical protein IJF59_03275 [Clostridia bacterium]|nr:hypothetical protein [Clostridia bacterium]